MPHYFFNVFSDGKCVADSEGQDCSDRDAVKREAYACARDVIGHRLVQGHTLDGDIIEVRDERGQVVEVVKLSDVIRQSS